MNILVACEESQATTIELRKLGHNAFSCDIIECSGGHPEWHIITIKDKRYPIKLVDGCYIIRKLTVTECMRLQTVPEWYEFPVSDSQAYKMLGNGWTVEVIVHLINATQIQVRKKWLDDLLGDCL